MHNSTILVFDPDCGFFIVAAMLLTAVPFMAVNQEGK